MAHASINSIAERAARSIVLALVLLASFVPVSASYAATPVPAQNAMATDQVEPAKPRQNIVERLRGSAPKIRSALKQVLGAIDELPAIPKAMWASLRAAGAVSGSQLIGAFLTAFFVGVVFELIMRRAARPVGTQAEVKPGSRWRARLGMLLLRAVIEIFAVAAFAAGSLATMVIIDLQSELSHLLFIDLLWLIVMIRMVGIVSCAALAPRAPALRLFPLDDATALTLHRQMVGIAVPVLLLRLHMNVMADFGLALELSLLVGMILSALVILLVIAMILYWRESAAAMLLGGRSSSDDTVSPLKRRFVDSCHVLAIAYVVGVWLFAMGVRLATGESVFFPGILSLLVLVAVPVADLGLRALARRWFGPDSAESAAADSTAGSAKTLSYERVALRNMRILLAVVVVLALARAWHMDLPSIVEGIVGARVANALLDVGITLLFAYALWSVVKTAVMRHASTDSEEGQPGPEGDAGGAGATRLQTLLPLVQKFLLVTLVVIVTMVALSSAGVEIGPLLAGAGMVGIAIGFGAQALVRDIVSGLFFLIDDAFRMGEYVEIGETRGTVEKISIRSMQLRHHRGLVHTVPFGEIRQLTNYSRDWHIMKFELRLPFETDINRVRKIIKKVGQEMKEDPELGPMMLSPLKSQGVNRMDDSALIIRCKVTCVPGEQFMVRREAYTRIQKAFEENDIHFAPRRVIVEASTPEQAARAAADILEGENEKRQKPPDDPG